MYMESFRNWHINLCDIYARPLQPFTVVLVAAAQVRERVKLTPESAAGADMPLFSLDELAAAAATVRAFVAPTPAYEWPLLSAKAAARVVVKHENHTPTGSFKARAGPAPKGLVTATRGNHGQSVALAAARQGIRCTIVIPEGNSPEKNAAMRA